MVDFQSRDTSRGLSDDADDEDGDAAATDEEATETGADHTHENGHDHHEHEHGHEDADTAGGHAGHHHADVEELGVAVATVSSSRDIDDDPSGDAIQSLVEDDGHSVVARDLVADDLDGIQRAVLSLTGREDVDVVVTTGGTGVTPDDVTVEAVEPLFDKELPGFGELFRVLSYEEVGTRALGSRATAGISEGVPVFCLPGSEDAARTGLEELVLAEAPHLVGLARDE
jgi:molybdenum cofactor biosynthesis protein B